MSDIEEITSPETPPSPKYPSFDSLNVVLPPEDYDQVNQSLLNVQKRYGEDARKQVWADISALKNSSDSGN